MPNSPSLWIAAGTLWILDASINVSMEPFRALVGDVLPPEQRGLATPCSHSLLALELLLHRRYVDDDKLV